MTEPSHPADDAAVEQQQGDATPAPGGGDAAQPEDGDSREFGVRAAVERGPAELSSEGEPVRDLPHASLDDAGERRSTDEL